MLPTGLNFVVAYVALARAGLVAVPINPVYSPDEMGYIVSDAGVSALIASARVARLDVPVIDPSLRAATAHADEPAGTATERPDHEMAVVRCRCLTIE
ncbi:MAG: AMP-binding protein [Actinobacteria bacterium]|nr:AMP-binding protein [Actinomycetota bacterium]